jgi:tRNA A64-2'-O-ribosylphosphate transferase
MEPSVPIHIPVTDLPYEMLPAIRRMSIQQSLSREESSLPTILFTNLQTSTPWTFTRTLTSKLPSHPSGEVRGTATFEAITASGASTPALVYAEEGTFTTTTGASFTARRKYIYRLLSTPSDPAGRRTSIASIQPTDKHIAVYFDNTETADATADLFVEMGPLQKDADGVSWSAENRAQHLCGEDLYTAQWRFSSGMLEEGHRADGDLWWEVRYDVKGPKKDYVSETGYSLKRG